MGSPQSATSEPTLKPLFDRVLLEREKAEKVGSILMPDEAQKRHATLRCRVVAVGPTADDSIQVGRTVLIGQHSGAWLNASGKPNTTTTDGDYFIVTDVDILCEVVAHV